MDSDASTPLLQVEGLDAGYVGKRVLTNVSLEVGRGEIVALVGHNGSGKSTLLRVVFGVVPAWSGQVILDGEAIVRPSPRALLSRGVAYLPQGNRVFGQLTVLENLKLSGEFNSNGRLSVQLARVWSQFPTLRARCSQRAETLSGGEKQVLALASALMRSPRLLLLDEPSLGLAPNLVRAALAQVREASLALGASVLVVEQKVREVLRIAGRVYVLRNGSVAFAGSTSELADDAALRQVYL